MKKYTKPEVEITAFDFEDITMSSLSNASDATKNAFTAAATSEGVVVVDASGIEW